jgi:hypothetical protein
VRAMLLIPVLFLMSCAYADKDKAVMFGGKGAARGQNYMLIYNGEKSFRDGTVLAGTLATGYFGLGAHKATEATAQVTARETTKRAAAVEATKRTAITTHGAAYGTAVGAEVPGVVAPAPPVAPLIQP